MQEADLLNLIKDCCPNISLNKHQFIDIWRDYDVIIADKKTVFRIPKHTINIEDIEREKNLIDIIAINIPNIKIPKHNIVYWKKPFVYMDCIDGDPLSKEAFNSLSQNQKNSLAKDFANLLKKLHNIHIKEFEEIWYSAWWTDISWINSMKNEIISKCWHLISQNILKNILNYIQELWNYNHPVKVMTHGDLKNHNVFLDREQKSLLGIIDFSNARLTDPAIDFCSFLDFWEDFVKLILKYYWWDNEIINRTQFYRKRIYLFILMDVIENKPDLIENTLEKVNEVFS